MLIRRLLEQRARETPGRIAYRFLVDGEDEVAQLDYATLLARCAGAATTLAARIQPGDRVLLLFAPSLDFIPAFLGCLCAGGVAIAAYPPDPRNPAAALARLAGLVLDSGASCVVTSEPVLALKKMLPPEHPLAKLDWLTLPADVPGAVVPDRGPVDPHALAYLQYTSGSTSDPKGVMVTHANIEAHCRQFARGFNLNSESSTVLWLPVHHSFGLVAGLLCPLVIGYPGTQMSPLSFLEKPLRWIRAMSKYRGTAGGGPNFSFDLCSRAAAQLPPNEILDLSPWIAAGLGGEAVRPETLDRFANAFARHGFRRSSLKPSLGISEATLTVTANPRPEDPRLFTLEASALEQKRVALAATGSETRTRLLVGLGPPLEGQHIRIVDPDTRVPCAPDEVGEIWVKGPAVTAGYWRRSEETQKSFGARCSDGDGPFLRTGDLGFLLQGELVITGRAKELIIVRGANFYPQDIEASAERGYPAAAPQSVAAFSVVEGGEERLVVLAESAENGDADFFESRAQSIRQAIATDFEIRPFAVGFLKPQSLPRTASAKLQRSACKQKFSSGSFEFLALSADGVSGHLNAKASGAQEAQALLRDTGSLSDAALERRLERHLTEKIAGFLKIPATRVAASARLASLGLDSLLIVSLKADLEYEFNVKIAYEDLLDPQITLVQLGAKVVAGLRQRSSVPQMISPEELAREVRLPDDLQSTGLSPASPTLKLAFLTGATGYLGAFLLKSLLENTDWNVACLVRCRDANEGRAKLARQLRKLFEFPESLFDRIRIVPGELTEVKLGIEEALYQRLSREVHTVIHSGAWVNFVYPYSVLKGANVDGCLEVLRFASSSTLKPVHFMSSVAVVLGGGFEKGRSYPEQSPLPSHVNLPNGYEQSKWVADRIMELARSRGFPTSIYRVGYVTGESTTGANFRLDEFLPSMIKGCIQLGRVPSIDTKMTLVPIDYAVKALTVIISDPASLGRNFHINHPSPAHFREVVETIAQLGYPLEMLPFERWRDDFLALPEAEQKKNVLFPYRDFVAGLEHDQICFPGITTEDTLRFAAAVPCPSTQELLRTYFRLFESVGFLKSV